ncbi:F0F1 ATP synthase subunit B [Mesohalobacter halotolerans]|uniref:ATP synthase subunit b n=1 Tax=Mesohalobacter halotolerans TaxID=1883405 RepID=A0A4U5TSZ5_9FLAO|nr:F0F1 ATP synthase subunit B [Mesohalobacter halotolerans]TKS57243.1 F0F1 ATP synthase subunit B [Mesohalobacter halotolerans]
MKLVEDFSFGLFFWLILVLVVLIFLLRKYAWKPVLKSLDDREEGIQKAIDSAEEAKKEMQNLKADNEKMKQEARQERDAMLKEAQQMKKQMISEAAEEAAIKADDIIAKAQTSIQNEKKAAIDDLRQQVAQFSIEIAEKVLKEELKDKKAQNKLIDRELENVKLN